MQIDKAKWYFEVLGSGTSQGVPVIGCKCEVCLSADEKDQRLRSSFFVKKGRTKLLVDAGPDLRQQLLRSQIEDLDAVLITHEHQDHTAGLDELRSINFQQGHSVPIYCSEAVELRLREQYSYIFKNANYPGIPQIQFVRIPNEPFRIGDIDLKPIKLWHGQMPVWGFRFGDLAYLTDVNHIEEKELQKLQALEVIFLSALRKKDKHYSHYLLSEAIEVAQAVEAKIFYGTHISHDMGLHRHAQLDLEEGQYLAFDGLKLELP